MSSKKTALKSKIVVSEDGKELVFNSAEEYFNFTQQGKEKDIDEFIKVNKKLAKKEVKKITIDENALITFNQCRYILRLMYSLNKKNILDLPKWEIKGKSVKDYEFINNRFTRQTASEFIKKLIELDKKTS